MGNLRTKKTQSIIEYGLILVVIALTLLIMQVYVKRAYSGRLKAEADKIGSQYDPGHTTGYSETRTSTRSVTYTGGRTNSTDSYVVDWAGQDLTLLSVPDGHKVDEGDSLTFSFSSSSTNKEENVDAYIRH